MSDQGNSAVAQHGRHWPGSGRWWPWALIAAFVVVGVVGGLIGAAVASSSSPSVSPAPNTGAGARAGCPVGPVADQVLPSVVTIAATGAGGSGTGSGEVIRSEGYVLTNNHVIATAADGGSVEVLFADGMSAPASIVGRDVLTDLAVLKVQDASDLKPILLGSSESVRVGDPVIAIGAPLGLSGTVTAGIVSALDRTVQVPAENNSSALLVSAVQTDAAINPGNSGGALVNCAGELVGVPTAGASVPNSSGESSAGNIGLGFAVPVDVAKTISDEIISSGRANHSYFGMQTLPIQEGAVQSTAGGGLFVVSVVPGGPAAMAGMRRGDIITKIEGQPATSNVQLQELTLTRRSGDKVTLDYTRGGTAGTATVTLSTQP